MEESIIEWINTLPLAPISAFNELQDFKLLKEILAYIADSASPFEPVQHQTWADKKQDLTRLLAELASFFIECLGAQIPKAALVEEFCTFVDIDALSRVNDREALARAVFLVLAAAVKCTKQDQIIYRIMQLPTSVQSHLMSAIQQAMGTLQKASERVASPQKLSPSKESQVPVVADGRVRQLTNEVNDLRGQQRTLVKEKEQLMVAINDLDSRLQTAEKAKRSLEHLLEEETRKNAFLKAKEIESSPSVFESKSKRNLAQENDGLKALVQQRERTIAELKKQVDASSQQIFKIKELQDEVEILRDKSAQSERLQDKIKVQERRITELTAAKARLQEVEQQLETLLKQKQEWDDTTSRQIPAMRTKLESYKTQVVDLAARTADLEMKLSQKEQQLKEAAITLEASLKSQKQQDLLLKDLSRSSRSNMMEFVPAPQSVAPKKQSLANLIHTSDPEAEKKAKEQIESLNSQLSSIRTRLELVEDDLQTSQILSAKLQKDLHETRLESARYHHDLQSVTEERDSLRESHAKLYLDLTILQKKYTEVCAQAESSKQAASDANNSLRLAQKRIEELETKNKLQEMQNKLIVSAYYNTQLEMYKLRLNPTLPMMSLAVPEETESKTDAVDIFQPTQTAEEFGKMLDDSKWNAGLSDATEELRPATRRLTTATKRPIADRKLSVAQIRRAALVPTDVNTAAAPSAKAAPSKRLTLAERALAPRPPLSTQSTTKVNPYESAAKRQKTRE